MIQPYLPGFESFIGYNHQDLIIIDPEAVIKYCEKLGFTFLTDWNSGIFLTGKSSDGSYIPERVRLPSGLILDERDLLKKLKKCNINTARYEELRGAFYFLNALTHPDMGTKRHDGAFSFWNDIDEKEACEKYTNNPFFP